MIELMEAGRWTHHIPMRWADLDVLRHVNNATVVNYAAEVQALLGASGQLPNLAPTAVAADFLAPILLSREPIIVESEIISDPEGNRLEQNVIAAGVQSAKIVSTWADLSAPAMPPTAAPAASVRVRASDIDSSGAVSIPLVFELFQEARIAIIAGSLPQRADRGFVLATLTVRVHRAVNWREEPYEGRCWISRLGKTSITMGSAIAEGAETLVSADGVMVCFDTAKQTPLAFDDADRASLQPVIVN